MRLRLRVPGRLRTVKLLTRPPKLSCSLVGTQSANRTIVLANGSDGLPLWMFSTFTLVEWYFRLSLHLSRSPVHLAWQPQRQGVQERVTSCDLPSGIVLFETARIGHDLCPTGGSSFSCCQCARPPLLSPLPIMLCATHTSRVVVVYTVAHFIVPF